MPPSSQEGHAYWCAHVSSAVLYMGDAQILVGFPVQTTIWLQVRALTIRSILVHGRNSDESRISLHESSRQKQRLYSVLPNWAHSPCTLIRALIVVGSTMCFTTL